MVACTLFHFDNISVYIFHSFVHLAVYFPLFVWFLCCLSLSYFLNLDPFLLKIRAKYKHNFPPTHTYTIHPSFVRRAGAPARSPDRVQHLTKHGSSRVDNWDRVPSHARRLHVPDPRHNWDTGRINIFRVHHRCIFQVYNLFGVRAALPFDYIQS